MLDKGVLDGLCGLLYFIYFIILYYWIFYQRKQADRAIRRMPCWKTPCRRSEAAPGDPVADDPWACKLMDPLSRRLLLFFFSHFFFKQVKKKEEKKFISVTRSVSDDGFLALIRCHVDVDVAVDFSCPTSLCVHSSGSSLALETKSVSLRRPCLLPTWCSYLYVPPSPV